MEEHFYCGAVFMINGSSVTALTCRFVLSVPPPAGFCTTDMNLNLLESIFQTKFLIVWKRLKSAKCSEDHPVPFTSGERGFPVGRELF